MNSSDQPSPSSSESAHGFDRRHLLGLAGAAAAAPSLALLTSGGRRADALPGRAGDRLVLRPDSDGVTAALDVPVSMVPGRAVPNAPLRTGILHASQFSALGVTWSGGHGTVRVRTRTAGGGWTGWRALGGIHDRPDADSAEAQATPRGTSLAWVGSSDALQLEISGAPQSPVLSLIDPGELPAPTEAREREVVARYRGLVPPLHSRRDWGANPKLLNGTIERVTSIRQVHVHHTDNANDYTRGDVPAMIRSIYRYHTQTMGWSDIGYNFLVDKFGRMWVGRSGSTTKMARGAHTLGFNHCSVGVAVLGNFQAGQPNELIYSGIAGIAAWKLTNWRRNPHGRIWVTSTGSDKFRAGRRVQLPVIDGHRDTNDTDCPGQHLYAHLDRIRDRTAYRMAHQGKAG
ncbi:N-acetylmuramoyl-L-alanine amidase [Nocardioides ultimimeridianus]